MITKFYEITNGTGALLPTVLLEKGQYRSVEGVQRTIVDAEIGDTAGKTQDTTSDPTVGFLFAQVIGGQIKDVLDLSLVQSRTGAHGTPFNFPTTGTATKVVNIGWRVKNDGNVSSCYILDQGDDAATKIANGDRVYAKLVIGNV